MPKKAPTPQTAEWLARFKRDLTDDIIRDVGNYAEKVSAKLQSVEGVIDPGYADALVGDAIHDTMEGIRSWDPERRKLLSHLCGVVQSRAWADTKRAQRRRHIAFHEPDVDMDGEIEASLIETEMSLRRDDWHTRPEGALALAQLRSHAFAWLHAGAGDDGELLDLIGCYEQGISSEPDIRARLGWSEGTFNNVHRRFKRLRARMPEDLRDEILEVLTRLPAKPGLEAQR